MKLFLAKNAAQFMIAVLEMVSQIKEADLFGVFRAHQQPVQIPGASLPLGYTSLPAIEFDGVSQVDEDSW